MMPLECQTTGSAAALVRKNNTLSSIVIGPANGNGPFRFFIIFASILIVTSLFSCGVSPSSIRWMLARSDPRGACNTHRMLNLGDVCLRYDGDGY